MYRTTLARKLFCPKSTNQLCLHTNMGHQSLDCTISLVCDCFFWPHIQSDIEHYVTKSCCDTRAPLTNIVTMQPFDWVSIDFLHLDQCMGVWVVIVDHFACFAQAYATSSKSGKTTAKGVNLKTSSVTDHHSRTTPYHPMGNGQVERMNRPLLQMLKTVNDTEIKLEVTFQQFSVCLQLHKEWGDWLCTIFPSLCKITKASCWHAVWAAAQVKWDNVEKRHGGICHCK